MFKLPLLNDLRECYNLTMEFVYPNYDIFLDTCSEVYPVCSVKSRKILSAHIPKTHFLKAHSFANEMFTE